MALVANRRDDEGLEAALHPGLPERLAIGAGTAFLVIGNCRHPRQRIRALTLTAAGRRSRSIAHAFPIPAPTRDRQPGDGFWGVVQFTREDAPGQVDLGIEAALDDGQIARGQLGELMLLAGPEPEPVPVADPGGPGPLVAVCMATFDPPRQLLERQIASIRSQTHRRFICIVSDDCSPRPALRYIEEAIAGDPRFFLSRSDERLGPYRNFERALSMVPPEVEYVALADQDDRWYPDKLEQLVGNIGDCSLIYSDMRVVDEGGAVLSESYWARRRNNYTDLASLLLANTITGAASLFPRSLLSLALPFPVPRREAYHDHWLACLALASGRIAYLDRPLYEYVQHRDAFLGHAVANTQTRLRRIPVRSGPGAALAHVRRGSRSAYFELVCWAGLLALNVKLRAASKASPEKRSALDRVARLVEPPEPVGWLAVRALRGSSGPGTTLHAELFLLIGVLWRRLTGIWWRLRRSVSIHPPQPNPDPAEGGSPEGLGKST